MGLLLVAAATSSLLLISVLQAPLLASAAFFPRPKIGSYMSPLTSPKVRQTLKNFVKKHGDDIAEVAQNFLPQPGDSSSGGRTKTTDSTPATTAGLYLATIQVGTPPQTISGVLDISTELVWMQCASCNTCLPAPSFYVNASKTYGGLPCSSGVCQQVVPQTCTDDGGGESFCSYYAAYSNTSSTEGYLANDTFTFDTTPVEGMLFGCSDTSTGNYSGASGVFGLGRGPLSLVLQLGVANFSYLLAPDGSAGSGGESNNQIQLGGVAVPQTGRLLGSTPLYSSKAYPDLYYVGLKGVLVDGDELDGIPAGTFDLQNDGSGGVFLSTTVPVTYLLSDAYKVVREAFASRISPQPLSNGSLDSLCYNASLNGVKIPVLTLVFQGVDGGGDVTMELTAANYLYEFNDGEGDNLECLAVLPSEGASLLGSLLQTGTTMIYDLVGEQLTFVAEDSSPSQDSLAPEAPVASVAIAVGAVAVWVLRMLI